MTDLGILKSLDLRQIWQGEDRNFSTWLGENLDRLGDALGMTLEAVSAEKAVAGLPSDIIARDKARGRPVVIEGQLDPSADDGLGRLLTCAAGADACAVIWVAPALRDPHRATLDWLNAHSDEDLDFFGVALEAVQIDDSRPALNFKVTAFPNTWHKSLIERHDGGDDRDVYFYRFNEALIAALRESKTFPALPPARARSELMLHTAHGGVRYGCAFSRSILRAGLWIAFPDAETNRTVFERLRAQKREIEAALGGADLEWDFNPDRRAQVITLNHIGVDRDDETQIPSLAKWAADRLTRIKTVFDPRIGELANQNGKAQPIAV